MEPGFLTDFINSIVPWIEDFITSIMLFAYRIVLPILGLGVFIARFTPTDKDDIWFGKIINTFRKGKKDLEDAQRDASGK